VRVAYDKKVDALMVRIKEDVPIARTVEVDDGLLDLDADGNIVAFELLGASAIIERAAELATQTDLADELHKAVKRYAEQAQEHLEQSVPPEQSEPAEDPTSSHRRPQ
jgi:uncharacterized protein YuzE